MGIVINMSDYKIECDSMESEYGEEIMYAGWNPVVALACPQQQLASGRRQAAMSADLAMLDAELFLQKMYACQR